MVWYGIGVAWRGVVSCWLVLFCCGVLCLVLALAMACVVVADSAMRMVVCGFVVVCCCGDVYVGVWFMWRIVVGVVCCLYIVLVLPCVCCCCGVCARAWLCGVRVSLLCVCLRLC